MVQWHPGKWKKNKRFKITQFIYYNFVSQSLMRAKKLTLTGDPGGPGGPVGPRFPDGPWNSKMDSLSSFFKNIKIFKNSTSKI